MNLTDRDKLIIATALSMCPVGRLADAIGSTQRSTAQRMTELARIFNPEVAESMSMFTYQF